MSFWEQLFRTRKRRVPISTGTPIRRAADAETPIVLLPVEKVLGMLLETWDHRYHFELDRTKGVLLMRAGNFELKVTGGDGGLVVLSFEEAGKQHGIECTADEAPKIIEALLFPKN